MATERAFILRSTCVMNGKGIYIVEQSFATLFCYFQQGGSEGEKSSSLPGLGHWITVVVTGVATAMSVAFTSLYIALCPASIITQAIIPQYRIQN